MSSFRYQEHGIGYRITRPLRPWRPQHPIILSWIKPHSTILDAGCGDGVLGEKLISQLDCNVSGFDLDPIAVASARKLKIKARVHDADRHFPYPDKSFDIAVNCELLQFVRNPNFVVSETLRVGKTAIIAFPNLGFWAYRLLFLLGKFPRLALYGENWWDTPQIKFFSLSDFLSLPVVKKANIRDLVCIDWSNRSVSHLSQLNPNYFGRSCIIKLDTHS